MPLVSSESDASVDARIFLLFSTTSNYWAIFTWGKPIPSIFQTLQSYKKFGNSNSEMILIHNIFHLVKWLCGNDIRSLINWTVMTTTFFFFFGRGGFHYQLSLFQVSYTQVEIMVGWESAHPLQRTINKRYNYDWLTY